MGRFATPATVRCELSDGDWIEIKEMLTVGDQKRIEASGLKRFNPQENNNLTVDFAEFSFARTAAYLVDWSLRGADDKPVPVSRAAIEALAPETYQEIEEAITAHVEARAASKKTRAGA